MSKNCNHCSGLGIIHRLVTKDDHSTGAVLFENVPFTCYNCSGFGNDKKPRDPPVSSFGTFADYFKPFISSN